MISSTESSGSIICTPSLFMPLDTVNESYIQDSSMAFTAAKLYPENIIVEIFQIGSPVDGHFTYEFRGLGLDDEVLSTTNSLNDCTSVLHAIYLALQNKCGAKRIK
jgi:hypothetical protein